MKDSGILSHVVFDAENGALILNGVRYLLIRPETIIGIQKASDSKAMFVGGFEGGSRSAKKLRDEKGLTPQETLQAMCTMGTQIGWGKFKLLDFSENGFEFEVHSSPWAAAYGKSQVPVCHLVAGVFSGVASVIFGGDKKVKEIQCAACGAGLCRFST